MSLPRGIARREIGYGGAVAVWIDKHYAVANNYDVAHVLCLAGLDVLRPYTTHENLAIDCFIFRGLPNLPSSGPRCCRP